LVGATQKSVASFVSVCFLKSKSLKSKGLIFTGLAQIFRNNFHPDGAQNLSLPIDYRSVFHFHFPDLMLSYYVSNARLSGPAFSGKNLLRIAHIAPRLRKFIYDKRRNCNRKGYHESRIL
jgi:hypothetical protein